MNKNEKYYESLAVVLWLIGMVCSFFSFQFASMILNILAFAILVILTLFHWKSDIGKLVRKMKNNKKG